VKKTMIHARAAAAVFIATLPLCAAAAAVAKPVVVVKLVQASVVTAPDGSSHLAPLDGSTPVGSGAAIRYTVSAKDTGTDAARGLALTGRIPEGTAFTPGSVRGPGGHSEFSLDGKSFSTRPMVKVNTPAGEVMQPADPGQYIMIRWVKDGPLDAKSSTAFSYDVRIK
jgi:uncharacterized repeat protein (TIGR01451 family)